MELKYLRLIKTIADEGNIANSSEKLFLTQSALSHQLRELEERIGFKVFHRKRNQWTLTEEGLILYDVANKTLDNIDQGLKKIKNLKNGNAGSIRLSCECYSFYQGLPKFIQQMGLLYPETHIDLILEATHKPISHLKSNEIDIAITSEKPTDPNLDFIKIYEDEIFVLVHEEHNIVDKQFVTAEGFKNLHLIIHSYPLETVSIYERFLKPNHCMPKTITAIPLTEVAIEMVEANMGVTCLPDWIIHRLLIPKTIQKLKIGSKGLKRKHYLVYRRNDKVKTFFHEFISNFVEYFDSKRI